MNQLFSIKLLLIVIIVIQSCSVNQTIAQKERDETAQAFLEMLPKEVTKDNVEILGFKTLADFENLSLGAPIQEFMVRLDHLQKYSSEIDPKKLLIDTKTYIYPVKVNEKLQISIDVSLESEGWEVSSFGAPNKIKIIESERAKLAKRTSLSLQEFSLVKIPSLDLFFLSYIDNKNVLLVPLFDHPQLEFRQGFDVQAVEVFKKLSSWAKSHDGNPG